MSATCTLLLSRLTDKQRYLCQQETYKDRSCETWWCQQLYLHGVQYLFLKNYEIQGSRISPRSMNIQKQHPWTSRIGRTMLWVLNFSFNVPLICDSFVFQRDTNFFSGITTRLNSACMWDLTAFLMVDSAISFICAVSVSLSYKFLLMWKLPCSFSTQGSLLTLLKKKKKETVLIP